MSACCSSVSCCFLSHWFEASAHAVPQSPAAAFHSSNPQLMLFLLLPFTLVRSLSICCSSVSCCCLSHWFEASAHAVPQSPAAAFHTGSKPQLMLFLSLLLLSFTLVRSLSSCCSSVSCCLSLKPLVLAVHLSIDIHGTGLEIAHAHPKYCVQPVFGGEIM